MSVTDACMAVGATSLGSFCAKFSKIARASPSAYAAREHDAVEAMPACLARLQTRPVRDAREVRMRSSSGEAVDAIFA